MNVLVPAVAALLSLAPPAPFTAGPSVEGVSEYRLPNGFTLILIPDPSAATLTANLTVKVGGRHEGYGEKGMAHLLEHMLFKGSPRYKDPKQVMGQRGARWNGTTSEDRTNYFESLPASNENLDFVIRFEADRLVNAFVDKKDLDTEMTVVRNEFERAENNAMWVLRSRVRGAALPWHNYGRDVIGIRADIERVPIENLKAFYKRYYQPDNAVLVLSGKFDASRAFALVAQTFGKIPRPARPLPATYTSEPTQDGEREVTVRRVGGAPMLYAAWRIPAVTDPDFPALMVLQGVLGDEPQGRLHQTLVEGRKAAKARCDLDMFAEPGLFDCHASMREQDPAGPARQGLLGLMEKPGSLTDAEVARSRDGWLAQYEQQLSSTEPLAFTVSDAVGWGDWRIPFLLRDRLKTVTTRDVERVWATYFKSSNRTIGEYVPTPRPDRAPIPDAPRPAEVLAGYTGGEAVQQGEVFDPTPANIEARTRRLTLPNGARVVLMPRKTRGQQVQGLFVIRLGTAPTLQDQQQVAQLTAELLGRGTATLPYAAFRSELERLKSFVTYGGQGQAATVSITTKRPQLDAVLQLVKDSLLTPALDAKELELARAALVASVDQVKTEPQVLGGLELRRALTPLPPGHINAVLPLEEQVKRLRAVTPEQVKGFHQRFYGAQAAVFTLVGDFDPDAVAKQLERAYGGWVAKEKFEKAPDPYRPVAGATVSIPTPDKANAWIGAGTTLKLTDSSPDFPALLLATHALGGSPAARLFATLREKQGLSYGAYAGIRVDDTSDRAALTTSVIYNPQKVEAVEKGLTGELARWPTLTAAELDTLRSELLQDRFQSRGNEAELAMVLTSLATDGRTMDWEAELDRKLKALTPAEVNAAVKKYVDPSTLVVVKAGDFRAVEAPR